MRSGGITIAWVEHTADQIPQIVMLQPFCHKDFGIRSLGDRIKDLNQCVTLYPDIPKDKAFGNYYTPLGGKIFLNFLQLLIEFGRSFNYCSSNEFKY